MDKVRIGVLASGRGSNLQAIMDSCKKTEIDAQVVVVISDNPDAYALERAKSKGINAVYIPPGNFRTKLDPQQEGQYIECLEEHGVDLICMAGFMRIIHHPKFFDKFRYKVMNIHPSLLPAFAGLAGIQVHQAVLEYGVKISGCTVHLVTEGIDVGPIIIQSAVPVLEDDTPEALSERVLRQEHIIYPQAIQLFAKNRFKVEGRRVRII